MKIRKWVVITAAVGSMAAVRYAMAPTKDARREAARSLDGFDIAERPYFTAAASRTRVEFHPLDSELIGGTANVIFSLGVLVGAMLAA